MEAASLAGVAGEAREAIATMDVRLHRAGADTVAGIEIAVAGDAVIRPPTRLRPAFLAELDAATIGLARHARIELHGAKVVLIAALQMHDLAEIGRAHVRTPVTNAPTL